MSEPTPSDAMDAAAALAKRELDKLLEESEATRTAMRKLGAWWHTWFGLAGHKRLGRLIVKYHKEQGT